MIGLISDCFKGTRLTIVTKSDYSRTMHQINVSEFKAVCLRLLEQVRQTGEPIEILKNGELLAIVHPPPSKDRKKSFGAMKGTLLGPVGDLITPVEGIEWDALRK